MTNNVALLVAGIAGMILFDTIISGVYLKKVSETLCELTIAILLVVIAKLLVTESSVRTYLEASFAFWCVLVAALSLVIVIMWIHVTKILTRHNHKKKTPKPPVKNTSK